MNELHAAEANTLLKADNKNYFFVPENYFTNLPADTLTHIFIKSLPVANVYSVPANYFENFAENVLEKIKFQQSIGNASADKLFTVPAGYFDGFAENILTKIKNTSSVQQELEQLSPFLSKISKANVYDIPKNYFEHFNPAISNKNTKPGAKIISLKNNRRWLNYAAAACVAAVLLFSGYLYTSNKNNAKPAYAKVNVQKEISTLSDDEIADYLKNNTSTAIFTNVGNDDNQLPNLDVQNLLQNMSDEELQQYLDQHPEPAETAGGS